MTREEIEAKWEGMTPRERDAWIATDVMGWTAVNDKIEVPDPSFDWVGHFPPHSIGWRYVPNYSTDISAAWEVFIKIDMPSLKKNFDIDDNDYYLCKIGGIIVFGKTAPEAICKAALLAVLEG